MWLLFGVLIALLYITYSNKQKNKQKMKKNQQKEENKPFVPYRWTPDSNADEEIEAGMARLSLDKNPENRLAVESQDQLPVNAESSVSVQEAAVPVEEATADEQSSLALEEPIRITTDVPSPAVQAFLEPQAAGASVDELGHTPIRSIWEAGKALQLLSGKEPRNYSTFEHGTRKYPYCVSAITDRESARKWVDALQERLSEDFVAFIGTTRWEDENAEQGVEVVVGKGETPYEIIRLAQTDAVRYDLSTEDIINQLTTFDEQVGIRLYAAETDSVSFTLLSLPENVDAFGEELFAFCPDLADSYDKSVSKLAESLKDNRDIELRWL